ncbi:MAG: hypothetical protein R3C15_11210 [Thermoleophilia bacterium]
MFERDRTDIDQDIEFEFFDDPPTTEASRLDEQTIVSPPPGKRSGGRGPRRPGGGGGGRGRIPGAPTLRTRRPDGSQPWLKVALAGAAVVVLVIALVVGIQSCGGGKRDAYQDYFEKVSALASESAELGNKTRDALLSRAQPTEIQATLQGLSTQQQQIAARALELKPPASLTAAQANLVESMQLRSSGLDGMAQVFGSLAQQGDATQSGNALAEQAARLIASDVVYADSFQGASQRALQQDGVSGVAIPESRFVTSLDLYSPRSSQLLIESVTGSSSGGGTDGSGAGLHGNGVTKVLAQPGSLELSRDTDNEVQANESLAFDVYVENSGDFQEAGVEVTLTLQQPGKTTRKSATIDIINPGEEKVVKFSGFEDVKFAVPSKLRVRIAPVNGESNTANNSAEFPVIITLS